MGKLLINATIQQLAKKFSTAIAAFSLCMGATAIANAREYMEIDPQYSDYYGTLAEKQTTYYEYAVPAYSFGVLTLKNSGGSSDFDIFVSEYDRDWRLVSKGENLDTQTELIVTFPSLEDKYVYIKVVNRGSTTSEYQLYADYVSPINKFILSGLKTAFTCSGEDVSDRNADRILTSLFSVLERNGLTGIATDVVVNEMTMEMREQFGYGCLGDFAVDWTASIVTGFYKNYP